MCWGVVFVLCMCQSEEYQYRHATVGARDKSARAEAAADATTTSSSHADPAVAALFDAVPCMQRLCRVCTPSSSPTKRDAHRLMATLAMMMSRLATVTRRACLPSRMRQCLPLLLSHPALHAALGHHTPAAAHQGVQMVLWLASEVQRTARRLHIADGCRPCELHPSQSEWHSR